MRLTTLCYIEKDGCYLMMNRNKKQNDENQGKWIGVGGHLEENESPEECIVREVREETGMELTEWKLRGILTFILPDWGNEMTYVDKQAAYSISANCENPELALEFLNYFFTEEGSQTNNSLSQFISKSFKKSAG